MHSIKHIGLLVSIGCSLCLWACGGGGGGGGGPETSYYTISGTILAAAGNQVDSDVNDTGTTPVANNDVASAQPITAPGVIGGYVNRPGAGEDGNSYANGDTNDYFQATLTADTTIRLVLPDESTAVVTLTVYDDSQIMVDTADADPYATVSVESDGVYYIRVQVVSGATSYRLMVGATTDLTAADASGSDFVPGEVLVRLKTNDGKQTSRAAAMADFAERTGLKAVQMHAKGWMHLKAEDRQKAFRRLDIPHRFNAAQARSRTEETRIAKQDTLRMVRALRRRPDVAHAQPNFIRRPFYTPDTDPLYPLQWHLGMTHLPEAWDITTGDADVIVAVLDTGILPDHPDLEGKIIDQYDFVSDRRNARDADGVDDDATDPGDYDYSFHGTHTAGTIAAGFDNVIGVTGVGGATRIMPVRVLGWDGGTDADIANAIRWAAGLDVTVNGTTIPGAATPADIINMSLGGPDNSEVLRDAVVDAYNAGSILIAAAGNAGDRVPNYPAAYSQVISVSAVEANARIAAYSNFGPTVDVAAPGGDIDADAQPDGYADGILSTVGIYADGEINYGYTYYHGTSMATAHMSGVAALMKAVRPGLDADGLLGYLNGGMITSDLGLVGKDAYYGNGLIDAYRAVVAAAEEIPPTILSVTPASLRLDAFTTRARLYLSKIGVDDLQLTDFTSDQEWLSIEQSDGQALALGDFGQYTVTVNRAALSGGMHTATIEFVSSVNTVIVPITIEVLPDANASAATQYLLLINASNDNIVKRRTLLPSNGQYRFTFENVPEGSYYLLCGSDLNNDYSLIDLGEAVGGYPSLGWDYFTLNRNRRDIEFVTGFAQWSFLLPTNARR